MKTLDRNRPFGTIYPEHEGAQYEQDGLFFDAQGKQCGGVAVAVETPPASQTGLVNRRGRKPKAAEAPPVEPALAPDVAAQLADGED